MLGRAPQAWEGERELFEYLGGRVPASTVEWIHIVVLGLVCGDVA